MTPKQKKRAMKGLQERINLITDNYLRETEKRKERERLKDKKHNDQRG
jgi:hypothetical protein